MAIVPLIFHPLPEICFELLNPLGMLWFSGQVVEFIGINGEIVELMLGPGPNAIDHRLGMRIRLHAINHGGINQTKIGLSGFTGQITGGDIHTVKIMGSEVPNEFVLSIRHRTDAEVGIRRRLLARTRGMTVPVFRPAIPSLHPALTFRCSVASLARCTNF